MIEILYIQIYSGTNMFKNVLPSAPVGWAQEWPPAIAVLGIPVATGNPRFRYPRWSRQSCAPHVGMFWGILVMEETSVDINVYVYIYTYWPATNYIHDAYMCWYIWNQQVKCPMMFYLKLVETYWNSLFGVLNESFGWVGSEENTSRIPAGPFHPLSWFAWL